MSTVCPSKFLFTVLVVAVGSGFNNGYHVGINHVSSLVFQNWIKSIKTNQSESEISTIWSITTTAFALGTVLGTLLAGYFSEFFGRKKTLLWNNVIIVIGNILILLSKKFDLVELFVIGEMLVGISIGLNCGTCQIYLVEIAPVNIRGLIAGLYSFFSVFFILISQIVGVNLRTNDNWLFIFIIALVPPCIQFVCFIFCPESPKHLVINLDEESDAEVALTWLRDGQNVKKEMRAMIEEDNLVKQIHAYKLKLLFTDVKLRAPLFVSVILNLGNELSGIKCVFLFSVENLLDLGFKIKDSIYTTISITTLLLLVMLIGLLLVDRVGRKKLMLLSYTGMTLDSIALAVTLIIAKESNSAYGWKVAAVVFHFIFVGFYGIGVGIIPYFIPAELLVHSMRAAAVSIALSSNRLTTFLIEKAYLSLREVMGYYLFSIFVIMNFFFYFYTKLHLPETAQLSAKELLELYDDD